MGAINLLLSIISNMSYINDYSYKDHQDLLWKAAMVELNKEKEQHRIDYHTTNMFPKAGNAPGESTWIAEMSEGIAALEKEDASMEANKEGPWEEHDEDVKTINKLKTKKQRRKELKLKREDRKIKKDKQEKLKEQDVFKIKSMNKEISAEEKRISQNIAKRNERKEIKKGLPDSITGYKFEEQDLDLKVSNMVI